MTTGDQFRGISRRSFLASAGAAGAIALVDSYAGERNQSPENLRPAMGLIDVNTNLFRWPTRRLPYDSTAGLVARLRHYGVLQAWCGSFEGLLHRDVGAVNRRLASECDQHGRGLLLPFGSINPRFPDWEEELHRCADVYRMRGIRLNPDYHGYNLADPEFMRLLGRARDSHLIVQLALCMEDQRTINPRLHLEALDLAPLTEVVSQLPGLKLVLLNALRTWQPEQLRRLVSAGEVYVEIAMLEGVGGVARLLQEIPTARVLFGSHAPFYYFESAWLKLQESALTAPELQAVGLKNARRLLTQTATRV